MIYEFHNLMDHELCDSIIQYFETSNKRSMWQDHEFFHGRTLSPLEIDNVNIRKGIKAFIHRLTQRAYLEYHEFLYPEFCDIVQWSPGMNMGVHLDDDKPELSMRHYTAMCYLNDDYKGGETFLPEHSYKCIPKKGKVVIFPSYFPHGVNLVENSMRYTVGTWFTRDEKHLGM